jgi:surfeit locus 1 family protein
MRNHAASDASARPGDAAPGSGKGFARRLLVPTLAALVAIPLFCGLGAWQLERAAEKRALQAEYDRRAEQPPVPLTPETVPAEAVQFGPVVARGTYDSEYELLWDNRIHDGRPGYHVLTPLRIEGGRTRVLVNRGWVPADPDRERLPATDAPDGTVTVRGTAVVPHMGLVLGELDPLTRTEPTVWQQIDLERYAAQVDWPLQPVVILLDPESPGGYVREWARLDAGVAVHQGYAFQWFTLAVAVAVMYGAWLVRTWRRARARGRGA